MSNEMILQFADVGLRVILGVLSLIAIVYITTSAIRTFVLPRADNAWLSKMVFRTVYSLFNIYLRRAHTYEQRDKVLALFGPIVLLTLPIVLLALLIIAFTPLYWAIGVPSWYNSFLLSGSSLLTLGYAGVADKGIIAMIISFNQAALGMIMVALLIAYLPTIYTAFSSREKQVALLEIRAGTPPSAVTLLGRVFRNGGTVDDLDDVWARWEDWFAQIEENHTSLSVLIFFRSQQPDRSWITAAGAVLDAASLMDSVVDRPRSTPSVMMIRGGYIALRKIADFFNIDYKSDVTADDPISITREEFDEACAELEAMGVPLVADRDLAWQNFRGWRVNYDHVLVVLARIIAAPYAPWSSDRSIMEVTSDLT